MNFHKSNMLSSFFFLLLSVTCSSVDAADAKRWDLTATESDVDSVTDCVLSEEAAFGVSNEDTSETVIKIFYDLEISGASTKTDEEIVGGIESKMLEDIVMPEIFSDYCASPEGRKKKKRSLLRGPTTSHQRRLNVASGVSTEPADKIIPGAPCTTSSDENTCIVVESGFTLYSIPSEESDDPLASNSVMAKIEEDTRNSIKAALESGYFNNDDIVGVSMKSEEEIEELLKEQNFEEIPGPPFAFNVNTKSTDDGGAGSDTLLYSIAAVAAALVIVFGSAFYIKQKKKAREQQGQRALASKDVARDLPVYEEGSELVTKEISNKTTTATKTTEEKEEKATVVFEKAASSSSSNNNNNDNSSSEEETSIKSGSIGSVSRASVVKSLGGGIVLSTDDKKDTVSVGSSTSRASAVKRLGGGQVDNKDTVSVSNASMSMKRLGGGQVVIQEESEEEDVESEEDASTNNTDNRSKASNSMISETASIVRRLGGGLMGQFLGSTTGGSTTNSYAYSLEHGIKEDATTGSATSTPMPKHDEEA